jgi:formiminotetrahydrofolate cyclodeaminase
MTAEQAVAYGMIDSIIEKRPSLPGGGSVAAAPGAVATAPL